MAAVSSKVQCKEIMASKIKWKKQATNNRKDNPEVVFSEFKDLCNVRPCRDAKEQTDKEMSFFNQKGRHRRGTKTQFHQHHHVPITPLTSFCHSSTESSKEKPSKKYNSPSVCNDANCQKERKCWCCCEFTDTNSNEKTKVSNNQNVDHPTSPKLRQRGAAEMTTKEEKKLEDEDEISSFSSYSVIPPVSHSSKINESTIARNGNIFKSIKSNVEAEKKRHDFQQRRSKTALDEKILIRNNPIKKNSPLARSLLLEDTNVGLIDTKEDLISNRTPVLIHHTELMASTPERKKRNIRQNLFNLDFSKDQSKAVEKGSENTTVAVSKNLGKMMDEIKISNIIMDKDLDEMKEKSVLLEKDILLPHAENQIEGIQCYSLMQGAMPSSQFSRIPDGTYKHNLNNNVDVGKKKDDDMVHFRRTKPTTVSCQSRLHLENPKTHVTFGSFKEHCGHENLQLPVATKDGNESYSKREAKCVIRERKSGLIADASQVIPSDSVYIKEQEKWLKSNPPGKDNQSLQKTTFFGTPCTVRKYIHERSKKDNHLEVQHSNNLSSANGKNIYSKKSTPCSSADVNVKEKEDEKKQYPEAEASSTAKIFCQPRQNDVFVENLSSNSPQNSNFVNRILQEREKEFRIGGPYHIRSDGILNQDNRNAASNVKTFPIKPTLQNKAVKEKNVKINCFLCKIEDNDGDKTKQLRINKKLGKVSKDSKLQADYINIHDTNQPNYHYCNSTNSSRSGNNINTTRQVTMSCEKGHYIKCCHKNYSSQNISKREMLCSQKHLKLRNNMKSFALASDKHSGVINAQPKETEESQPMGKYNHFKPCIKIKNAEKRKNLHYQINCDNSNDKENVKGGLSGECIPMRRAKTDLTLYSLSQQFGADDIPDFDVATFSTPRCRKPINSAISRMLQSRVFSKSDNNIEKLYQENPVNCKENLIYSPQPSPQICFIDSVSCIDGLDECRVQENIIGIGENCCQVIGYDHIVHDKRRIPDGMAHMTEVCTRHKYQNNINRFIKEGICGEKIHLDCSKCLFLSKEKDKRDPKTDTFSLVFCSGKIPIFHHCLFCLSILLNNNHAKKWPYLCHIHQTINR